MRQFATCVAMIGALAALPRSAAAEPIRVTGGGFELDFEGAILHLLGDGFVLGHAPDPVNLGLFIDRVPNPNNCGGCDAGQEFSMTFTTPGEVYLGIGNATIDGATYSNVTLQGSLDFQSPSVTLPVGLPPFSFFNAVSPFVFNGQIRGLSGGTEVFNVSLTGSGQAFTGFSVVGSRFISEEGEESVFTFQNVAATPEPSTLVLVGLGLAGAVRARRAKRDSGGPAADPARH